MRKVAFVVFAALAGTSPALAQSQPADAGAALLAPGSLTTELPNGFQQNSNSKLQALIPSDLSRFVDRKPEQTAVEVFYQGRNYQPIWTGSPEAMKRAEGAIAFLRNVRSEGLEPRDYPTPDLSGNLSEEQAAKAELQLTGSILRYARHASSGRVSYTRVSASILYPDHATDPAEVLNKVASAKDVNAVLQAFEPQQPGFVALKAALAKELATPEQDPPLQDREISKEHRGKDADDRNRKNTVGTIIANMERWRWLPRDLGDRYILVNIPEMRLDVYEGNAVPLTMRVVVGKPDAQTPIFNDEMTYIVFSPYWNVPASIAEGETLPAIMSDPDFLARNNMEIVDSSGNVVDPETVDLNDPKAYRFRQRPGTDNSLGLVKFMFPNQFNVYLHDTPANSLFDRAARSFSHGCVRIEDPVALAQYVLRDQPEWTRERIGEAMRAGEEETVKLKSPIPVYLGYWTARVRPDNTVQFRKDVYDVDGRLTVRLADRLERLRRTGEAAAAATTAEAAVQQPKKKGRGR